MTRPAGTTQRAPVAMLSVTEAAQLALFVVAIFMGAVLVFGIQPIAARMLLPPYGGSPSVWTASSFFFQVALLAGYAYSHLITTRLRPRAQVLVHLGVLVLPLVFLPFVLTPAADRSGWPPALEVLAVLAVGLGVPFVVASTTGPLLQRWFSLIGHRSSRDPYFLYVASNAGSLLILLLYPVVIEPRLDLPGQRAAWSIGYVVFGLLVMLSSLVVIRRDRLTGAVATQDAEPAAAIEARSAPDWLTKGRWILLAAVPAALSLGATQHISTDVAAVPLLWVIPLAIYLASFMIAFSPRNPFGSVRAASLLPVPAVAVAVLPFLGLPILAVIVCHLALLLVAAVMCHARLAEERPAAEHLTGFYLFLSVGGALGGAFVSLIGPLLFDRIWEYPIAILAAILLRPRRSTPRRVRVASAAAAVAVVAIPLVGRLVVPAVPLAVPVVGVALAIVLVSNWRVMIAGGVAALLGVSLLAGGNVLYTDRTFFGVHRVVGDAERHQLIHGTTVHGLQIFGGADTPSTYFHPTGPIGEVFALRGSSFEDIRLIGLGVGTLAAYGSAEQRLTFYEIDPGVVEIARDPQLFTYLADSDAAIEIVVADGRLGLARDSGGYDLLVVDAFTSDAIPVHLLTREAVQLYTEGLAPDGLVAIHISNRYIDLEPVLGNIATSLDLAAVTRADRTVTADQAAEGKIGSHWVLLAREDDALSAFGDTGWRPPSTEPGARVWTDAYSNLIDALR